MSYAALREDPSLSAVRGGVGKKLKMSDNLQNFFLINTEKGGGSGWWRENLKLLNQA